MAFDVSRLEKIERIVVRLAISEMKFINSFSEFRQERQVINETIV
jgi:transcription termination factor NusB